MAEMEAVFQPVNMNSFLTQADWALLFLNVYLVSIKEQWWSPCWVPRFNENSSPFGGKLITSNLFHSGKNNSFNILIRTDTYFALPVSAWAICWHWVLRKNALGQGTQWQSSYSHGHMTVGPTVPIDAFLPRSLWPGRVVGWPFEGAFVVPARMECCTSQYSINLPQKVEFMSSGTKGWR